MSGELDLSRLLATLKPLLSPDLFVFATIQFGEIPAKMTPIMSFQEAEGITVILKKSEADSLGLAHEFPCRMITLDIHSSLEAVGFIAHIATRLAKHGMGVNPVSGFYHDHLFVPDGKQQEAMKILQSIASEASLPT